MKNTLLLALLLLVSFPALGQIENYRTYQQNIHTAELYLVRGQKQAALDKYQEVLLTSRGNAYWPLIPLK